MWIQGGVPLSELVSNLQDLCGEVARQLQEEVAKEKQVREEREAIEKEREDLKREWSELRKWKRDVIQSIEMKATKAAPEAASPVPSSQEEKIVVKVWNGTDRTCTGKRLQLPAATPVSPVVRASARALQLPPASLLFHPNGSPVTSASHLIDGSHFLVIPQHATYSEGTIPTALLEILISEGSAQSHRRAYAEF
eukprot:TRINITY_DN31528_c0_g1_i1.p1 TRINITY_DN31528_c0_g1~~TRINITY_DN31528_c0_g1_i1.p1  ORF type:complete len:195 (+),score=33.33 TRINITY_DN31528_c0_g1_i1:61-645(+)